MDLSHSHSTADTTDNFDMPTDANESLVITRHDVMFNFFRWAPCLIVLTLASLTGTCGNLVLLAILWSKKNIQNVETMFIANLALSDLYVTTVADPMSFIGTYFTHVLLLCSFVAVILHRICIRLLYMREVKECVKF